MAWTDEELRASIFSVRETDNVYAPLDLGVNQLRAVLTALGIDHQPKLELPDTPGSVIYDVDLGEGCSATVLTRDRDGYWVGIEAEYLTHLTLHSGRIVSFGGVLDLDKVRGEQGE